MTNAKIMAEINKKLTPKHRGMLDGEEVALVKDIIKFDNFKTEEDLRNLRDTAVMFFTIEELRNDEDVHKVLDAGDKMSAIVCVIDGELWNRGYNV